MFRVGMIVLDEFLSDAYFCERFLVIAFEKKSAAVFKNLGFKYESAGNRSRSDLHEGELSENALFEHLQKINSITIVLHGGGSSFNLAGRNIPVAIGNLLRASDHQSLTRLNGLNKERRFEHSLVSPRIKPSHASAHYDHVQH